MLALQKPPEFPLIHFSKRNDVVERLVDIIDVYEHNLKVYKDENERLKGIIAELQNAPKKPEIKPSSIEKPGSQKPSRPHEPKGPKVDRLTVHEQITLRPQEIPAGSTFKGYRTYFVQDIELKSRNILCDLGRRSRDVFCSLIKTCLKLNISFWSFLESRVQGEGIPSLSELVKNHA